MSELEQIALPRLTSIFVILNHLILYSVARFISIIFFLVLPLGITLAQETIVQGKVTDANSGDPIPFANVHFKGTGIGTATDFDGNYRLKIASGLVDSLIATYVSYKPKSKAVIQGVTQTINFQLSEDLVGLQEVVVSPGENPAFEILRNVVKNKAKNDKRKLSAYEFDTYTKIEIDVDNISEKLREKKIMKKIAQVLDSIDRIAGEDGKPILPLFIAESVSKSYYRQNPTLKKEYQSKSKISGVGIEDGTLVTQLVGSSFQEYNFYQNWLTILTKEFVSPIADGWRLYYEFDLTDSLFIDDQFCYRLDFFPKSPQELAFNGSIWITKKEFALKRIDATVGKQANINFVEKIKIQQDMAPTNEGAWLPVKNRVLIDIGELTGNSAGMLAKFYTSNKNFVINKPHEAEFYSRSIEVAEDARLHEDEKYWDSIRHEPLSRTELNVYKMIDTLRNIPIIKTYTDILKIIFEGYFKVSKDVEIGPYLGFVAWNNIEGFRVQCGFKTTYAFSKKFILGGQLAYGFTDQKLKYLFSAQQILSRHRWTVLGIRARSDLARIGVDEENLADNPLFLTATRWGYFRRGYYFNEGRASIQRQLFKGFSAKMSMRYWTFEPTYNFGYYQSPSDVTTVFETFKSTDATIEARYAFDEVFIQDENDRISMGTTKSPVITLRYTRGLKGVFGSNYDFDKLRLSLSKRIRTGPLGVGYVSLNGEYIFNTLPYPMLALHLGNQSFLYSSITYNLMNYGEFTSDHFASLQYRQYLEGFLMNRIPLIRKLNWRLLGTANVIMGGLRDSNKSIISDHTISGDPTLQPGFFEGNKPYVELGYGVENIFRFLRVDFVHRLSYLDHIRPPGEKIRSFGVFFTVQFQL